VWLSNKVYGTYHLQGDHIFTNDLNDVNTDLIDLEIGRDNDPGAIEPQVINFSDNKVDESGNEVLDPSPNLPTPQRVKSHVIKGGFI
jgi:hypothetical protein